MTGRAERPLLFLDVDGPLLPFGDITSRRREDSPTMTSRPSTNGYYGSHRIWTTAGADGRLQDSDAGEFSGQFSWQSSWLRRVGRRTVEPGQLGLTGACDERRKGARPMRIRTLTTRILTTAGLVLGVGLTAGAAASAAPVRDVTLVGSHATASAAGAVAPTTIYQARADTPRPDATVNGNCSIWTDGNTFGIGCTGMSDWGYFAFAYCANGDVAIGNEYWGTSGTKSYAYCSTYNSSIAYVEPSFTNGYCNECSSSSVGARSATGLAGRLTVRPSYQGYNTSCSVWSDGTTFGIGCGVPSYDYYDSVAVCNNGDEASGPYEPGGGGKSYAYCSTYHSQDQYAYSDIMQESRP
jgi:hypothetical protein